MVAFFFFFFEVLRGQKSKIGSFCEFIPGFPKRLGRIVFEHFKLVYYNVVCKICGSVKSVIFEVSEKNEPTLVPWKPMWTIE